MIENLKRRYIQLETLKLSARKRLHELQEQEEQNKRHITHIEEARALLQEIARQTQEELSWRVSEIVTLALAAVFPDPYEFKVMFENKRGRTTANLIFLRNSQQIHPIDAGGGGTVDVASFALRVAMWNIKRPHTRNTLFLDEPFKNVSKEYREDAAIMLEQVSEKLKLQIIMVTHDPVLVERANTVFSLTKKGSNSIVLRGGSNE